jgi:hypothetical protein
MPTRCRQISERHMIALWTTLHRFIPGRESLQNSRRKSSLMATSLIILGSCRWTIGTRFTKRSRHSASSVPQYLLVRDLRMRRAGGTARASRLLCVLSGIAFLGLHEFFGEIVEELQSPSRASADSDSVDTAATASCSRYAVTCLNAATKLSISVFFPIVTRM